MIRPTWLSDEIVVRETMFEWNGIVRPLYILIADLRSAPPNFVGFPPPREFFIVSEAVPVEYWRAVLGHEAIEFLEYGEQPNRCRLATERELELVAAAELEEYITWRIKFFEGLSNWAMQADGDTDQLWQIVEGAAMSLAYLRLLQ